MSDELERGHLNLGLGEIVALGEPAAEVTADRVSQNEAAGGELAGATEEVPFAGGAGEGDDLPESGLRSQAWSECRGPSPSARG